MAFTNVNKNGTVVLLHSMKANKGGGRRDPLILNLGVILWWLASTPAALLRGKSQRCSLKRKVGELQSRSGRIRKEGNLLPLPDSNPVLSRP